MADAPGAPDLNGWEPVIGLEIHVQLKTRTKMFCRCELSWAEEENSRTCPVCLAHPGALPVPNRRAIEWTIRLGLALGCTIAPRAVFARKNYFYPDLPKGYQISQYDQPSCEHGSFLVPGADASADRTIGITRAHLEEDAAKTVHVGGAGGRIHGADRSLVDFNRGGTPLVEIVTEPDIRDADEARRFLQLLRQTVVELGISDAEMERGSLRCDANVSVRRPGEPFRTKAELKNMNSFKFVADGIDAEIARQIAIYESGGTVLQQTLHYDPNTGSITPLRTKEEADDYRYFPEPDMVPVEPSAEMIEEQRAAVGEVPSSRIVRLRETLGPELAVGLVTSGRDRLYDRTVAAGADPRAAANVVMNQLAAAGVDPAAVDPAELAKLVEARDRIPRDALAEALARAGDPGFRADDVIAGSALVDDTSALEPVVDAVIAANPGQVEQYRGGKEALLGFFVGQVMKQTGGKASPKVVNELVRAKLSA
jgi:aspartyl-tRNA(Asn)/glutamyl-tRNA(Gln) amidotransferase subunit B